MLNLYSFFYTNLRIICVVRKPRPTLFVLLIVAILSSACMAGKTQPLLGLTVDKTQATETRLADSNETGQRLDTQDNVTAPTSFTRETCPMTTLSEPAFIPPEPYPQAPPEGYFWIGAPNLWTAVPLDGSWSDLPWTGHGYSQKMVWWREGYDSNTEPEPALSLTGQRLDAADTFETTRATNATAKDIGRAMMVGIEIPSAGCWQITASYKQSRLSIVVWVGS